MKHLRLSVILEQIGEGVILQGSGNPVIKNVLNSSEKNINDHTLVFHMDRDRIRGNYWNENEPVVIITDVPDQCTGLNEHVILIKTDHLEDAYWKFVDYYRGLFDIPVIGVTGTCGKTTTKEMIRHILLEEDYRVKCTWMSKNSMSVNLHNLTKIDERTEVAVYEMPVAYPGYLQVACRYFKPQIRILLNIGIHHLADCETPEAYMKAKAEITCGLDPENGILIINADDENIRKVVDVSPFKRVIYFGKSENATFQASNIQYGNGGMNFTLIHEGKSYVAFVPGYGEHNVYNALATISALSIVGMDIQTAIKRIFSFDQVEEHLEVKYGVNGVTVIDDSWNSAPLSMITGLQVLKDVSKDRKSIALLGYMPQLGEGEHAREQYEDMGKKTVQTGIDVLIAVGNEAEEIGKAALRFGMDSSKVYFCLTGEEVYRVLQPDLNENTIILLKVTHRVMTKPSFEELKEKLIPEVGENKKGNDDEGDYTTPKLD